MALMMAYPSTNLTSIRRLASPNAAAPLTEQQLPDDFIEDPVYLEAEERFILRKLSIPSNAIPQPGAANYDQVVFLIQIRVAMRLIPQLPLILRQTMVGETIQIQNLDWEKRLEELEELYADEVDEADLDPNLSAKIKVKVLATSPRPFLGPNDYCDPFGIPYYDGGGGNGGGGGQGVPYVPVDPSGRPITPLTPSGTPQTPLNPTSDNALFVGSNGRALFLNSLNAPLFTQ